MSDEEDLVREWVETELDRIDLGLYDMEGKPITMRRWGELLENPDRVLAQHHVGEVFISTVWLGMDHGMHRINGSEPPMIFETMIFTGKEGHDCYRYPTREAALEHHAELVAQAELIEGAKPA